jgi:hypothetical protein
MPDWLPTIIAAILGALASQPVWNALSRTFGFGSTENARLRNEIAEVKTQHEACEEKIGDLTLRLAAVEHHYASHFSRWLTDAHKRVIWVNSRALLTIFAPINLGRDEVEGRLFNELIDAAAAKEIDMLERAALASPGQVVSNLITLHPDLPVMHIVKVAASGREGELIYETIAFRTNDPEVIKGFGILRNAEQRARSIDNLASDQDSPA